MAIPKKKTIFAGIIVLVSLNLIFFVPIFLPNHARNVQAQVITANKCYIFTTAGAHQPNFGGLAGADFICFVSAAGAGWVGGNTWTAWLSDSVTNASNRVPQSTAGYFLPDETKIADDWADLTDGSIDNPINRDETGALIVNPNLYSWTATQANGTYNGQPTCLDWTSTALIWGQMVGDRNQINSQWSWAPAGVTCQVSWYRLYCISCDSALFCVPDGCNNNCPLACAPTGDPDCTGLGCCGDGACNTGETSATCPGDCAVVHGPNQCCKLDHNLTDIAAACAKDAIVGPSNPDYCDADGDGGEDAAIVTLQWGLCCVTDTVYTVSDYIFWIFLVLSAAIFIFAGYCFLFSGGGPQQIERGRGFLFWGVIALVVVVMSKIIPAIIKMVIS